MGNWFEDAVDGAESFFKSEVGESLTVGVASVIGFGLGGPAGAALLGGATSAGFTLAGGGDFGDAVGAFAMDGLLGAVGGGLGGAGLNVVKRGLLGADGTLISIGRNYKNFGWLGSKLRSNQAPIPHAARGALGSFLLPTVGNMYNNSGGFPSGEEAGGESGLGDLPVKSIGEDQLPEKLQPFRMPNPDDPSWPKEDPKLDFVPGMQENYLQLPQHYSDIWKSFGKDPTESSLPEEYKLPGEISDPESAGIATYPDKVEDLGLQFMNLRSMDQQVAQAVERTAEYLEAGKIDIARSVVTLGKHAKIHPANTDKILAAGDADPSSGIQSFIFPPNYEADGNFTENAYVLSLIEGAYAGMESIMGAYAEMFAALAEETKPPEESDDPDDPGNPDEPGTPSAPGVPAAPGPPVAPGIDDTPLQPPAPIDLGEEDGAPGAGSDKSDDAARQQDEAVRRELKQLGQDAARTGTGAAATPAMSGTAGSGLESMMLPMMMQAMMGNMANRQRPQTPDEGRRRRRDEPDQPQQPIPAPVPGAAPQASPQAAAPPAGTQPNAPRPAGAPPVQGQPATGKPAERGQGNVVYTFPDGRTQEVSAVVAQVLDAAFGNASATDAKAAYSKTSVTWIDEKDIGTRIDPYQLMTGDVGIWDERTAVLVVFDTETSGTLEAVVDGQLQPVVGPADMRDGRGEFGEFVGFFHPPGIEKTADQAAVPETPAAAPALDQSIAVAPA